MFPFPGQMSHGQLSTDFMFLFHLKSEKQKRHTQLMQSNYLVSKNYQLSQFCDQTLKESIRITITTATTTTTVTKTTTTAIEII